MEPLTTSAFELPDRLAAKADPALIAADERHFAAIAESLVRSITDLSERLDAARRAPGGSGQEAMDRDQEVHRLTARLRTLRRFGLDLCLGHVVGAGDPEPVYVGRLGLTGSGGRRLRVEDLQSALVDEDAVPRPDPDLLPGPFAHIVVDEAQELTDAEWQMLLLRCPSRSLTIVGDRAQARHGFAESWEERLRRVGLDRVELASLSINYRTPEEVMAEAEPVIRTALPDANVPVSIRSTGVPVRHGPAADLAAVLDSWLAAHAEGTGCVIAAPAVEGLDPTGRVRSLTPELAKGLEFDLVVLVDPDTFGVGVEGAVDRYVAMTRATQRLVVLTTA